MSYTVRFDENNQEIVLAGAIRPRQGRDLNDLRQTLDTALDAVSGVLYLNAKRLIHLNNAGFHELVLFIRRACQRKPRLRIVVVVSSYVIWQERRFTLFRHLSRNVVIEPYDQDFYPGQALVETASFIPLLRTQTAMTWQHERELLPRHGLRAGMSVADICCGIGDFALLVCKEFHPARLLAVDHAANSLAYARRVAADFGIAAVEYVQGDAASLLIDDDQFDFVICRHSLQIFNRPDQILKELRRITRPGGRIYLTNETYSKCFGYPHTEEISHTYEEASRLFALHGMDLECGPRMVAWLTDLGLEEIRIEPMILTNRNSDPESFGKVVQSWRDYVVDTLAAGETAESRARLSQGFQKHIAVLTQPRGFGGWPIWVASAAKP